MKNSWAAILLVAVLAGCGEGGPQRPTARLAGAITIDGQSLEQGQIQFMPEGSEQAQPTMSEIEAGRYQCSDVPQGQVRIVFHAVRGIGEEVEIFGRRIQATENLIPAAYRQGMVIEVAGDDEAFDFELSSHERSK